MHCSCLDENRFIADSAIRTIEEPYDNPVFTWFSFPDPHMPVAPPAPYNKWYDPTTILLPTHRLSVYPGTPDGELFDLQQDPDELHNLWYAPAHFELRADLVSRLLDAYATDTPWHPVAYWNS